MPASRLVRPCHATLDTPTPTPPTHPAIAVHVPPSSQTAQIAQLQKGLSDANVNVDVEREEAAHLRAEVQILRAEQVEDRKRMQQLLALTALREDGSANPGEEMTAFFPGNNRRRRRRRRPPAWPP